MQIKIKQLAGPEHLIDVQVDQLVLDLKTDIFHRLGLSIESQKLVYKGKTMQNSQKLSHYELEPDCKINLIVSQAANRASEQHKKTPESHDRESPLRTVTPGWRPHPLDGVDEIIPSREEQPQEDRSSCEEAEEEQNTPMQTEDSNSEYARPNQNSNNHQQHLDRDSKFVVILERKLLHHFPEKYVGLITSNLLKEIRADLVSSSLDDLERLAKQKLNISDQ